LIPGFCLGFMRGHALINSNVSSDGIALSAAHVAN
jgi:hypothetical protein